MDRRWTFGQKIAAGLGLMVVVTIALGAIGVYALRSVRESKDRVINVNAHLLIDAQRLDTSMEKKSAAFRGFLLSREAQLLEKMKDARKNFEDVMVRLESNVITEQSRTLLRSIEQAEEEHQRMAEALIAEPPTAEIGRIFEERALPLRQARDRLLKSFIEGEEKLLNETRDRANEAASDAITLLVVFLAAALLIAVIVAVILTRALSRQIGEAVGQVRSSSTELQAAANQQATGAKEQHTAMNEITTTISELLATSRQISDSAQRVAQIAEETARAARTGEGTVDKGQDSTSSTRRQVDLIVSQMLDLGKKSQQIGSVLEIVSELAEQTNILAINASIEAVGAGDAGKRFGVVADEIRKLADRVGGSTKEIRVLIDDMRSAVNTTVMTTEGGSKAVEAGAKQFGEVATAFKRITSLVETTTEAAKEIQLSTKQQTTAVEQVNLAISNVAQATKENEATSAQTLQTASQLAGLSRELMRLVQPDVN